MAKAVKAAVKTKKAKSILTEKSYTFLKKIYQ